jgi:hypothetical protein
MTQRWIYGRHPLNGAYGAWLSKPGIDATSTVDPSNFLLSPNVKNEQIIKSGSFVLAPTEQTIYYPYTLPTLPRLMLLNSSDASNLYYPMDYPSGQDNEVIYAKMYLDRIIFGNSTARNQAFFYTIVASNDQG